MLDRILNFKKTSWDLNNIQLSAKKELQAAITNKDIQLSMRTRCICGCNKSNKLSSVDRFGLNFPSYICTQCGLVFTSPYISEYSLENYYNTFYHPLTLGTNEPMDCIFAKSQGRKIFLQLKKYLPSKNIKIFEIGAGSGSNLLEFCNEALKQGIQGKPCGIEFNKKYVEYGNSKGAKLEQINLQDYVTNCSEKFDVIIMSHVFEHFHDPIRELESIKKISHNETLIYIEVPGILNLKNTYAYNCDILKYLTHAHTFNFSLASLNSVLKLGGLKLLEGNEIVEAVFITDSKASSISSSKNLHFSYGKDYLEIINYLKDLEKKLTYYQCKALLKNYLEKTTHKSKKLTSSMAIKNK